MHFTVRQSLILLVAGLSACADTQTPMTSADDRPKPTPHAPHFDDYPDSLSWVNAALPGPSLTASSSASFVGGYTQFAGTGNFTFAWANDVLATETLTLINGLGTSLNSGAPSVHWYRLALPVPNGDTTLTDTITTVNRKCGLAGKHAASGKASQIVKGLSTEVTMWSIEANTPGTDQTQPACAPPKSKLLLSHGGVSAVTLEFALPEGDATTVGIDGTGSAPGSDGGPAISSYAWTIGSTNMGSQSSFSANFASSQGVGLTVTDADGVTGNTSGSVTVDTANPCDDPLTRTVEDCTTNPPSPSETVSYGGGDSEPGDYVGGTHGETYVCYVTDWYEWNGSGWVYTGTDVDYCDFE